MEAPAAEIGASLIRYGKEADDVLRMRVDGLPDGARRSGGAPLRVNSARSGTACGCGFGGSSCAPNALLDNPEAKAVRGGQAGSFPRCPESDADGRRRCWRGHRCRASLKKYRSRGCSADDAQTGEGACWHGPRSIGSRGCSADVAKAGEGACWRGPRSRGSRGCSADVAKADEGACWHGQICRGAVVLLSL